MKKIQLMNQKKERRLIQLIQKYHTTFKTKHYRQMCLKPLPISKSKNLSKATKAQYQMQYIIQTWNFLYFCSAKNRVTNVTNSLKSLHTITKLSNTFQH